MGRNIKEGLDYFPFEVDFFTDIKVRKLIKHQGGKAITVYALLLCLIYKSGYYLRWDEELPFIISEQTGFEEVYILEVIKSCLTLGLFSKELYNSKHILTSKGIQERYIHICNTLKRKVKISPEIAISSEKIGISSEKIGISSEKIAINSEESTQKEKKEKKEINKESDDEFDRFWNLYDYKKGDKTKVKKKFLSLSMADREKIFETLPLYVESTPDKQYRKHPQTYLNNRSWEDEILQRNTPQNTPIANLGVGEFINPQGQRTYGSGKYIIPMDAPPRPGQNYYFDASTQKWML